MRRMTIVGFALLLAGLSGGPAPASAQIAPDADPVATHAEGERAIGRLRSPYCPGFMLENCTSGLAGGLRDSINLFAAEGWPADSIVEWVIGNHGEEFRAFPKVGSGGLLAWFGPPLFLVLGVAVVVVVLRRIRANAPTPEPIRPLTDAEEARLRTALRELETEDD